ncbi:SDR family oxidoreductase [Phenylobacterium sp.]|uniref:SDR family oxidoreductase n=1 Tax=Phenylobacterium sp. TaxID=1871053 RepID=UPI00286DC4DC|nr:SDR family oxidoreductase [Phenylobacterium sp.]
MTVLITGGTKGIGLAIARRLAPIHGRVVLAYHSDEAAAAAAHAEITALGAAVETVRCEVGSPEGAAALMAQIERQGHGLNHIVHAAAMIYPTTLLGADLAKFRQAVETNGLSLLYLVHAAQGLLGRGSSVVFITSMGSRIPSPNYGALGVGKALAEAIVRYLVAELAPRGVRINGVAPGLVHTTSVAAMLGSEDRRPGRGGPRRAHQSLRPREPGFRLRRPGGVPVGSGGRVHPGPGDRRHRWDRCHRLAAHAGGHFGPFMMWSWPPWRPGRCDYGTRQCTGAAL